MENCVKETEEKIRQELFALKDTDYKEFHRKLIPTVNPDTIIGIRTPVLRKYAKQLYKERKEDALIFMQALPHMYYEENNLHGCFIECMNDYDAVIGALNAFLPYVDNWATCDLISPKVVKKYLPELMEEITKWMTSKHTYTVRFGMEMLMRYYLDDAFLPEYLKMAASVVSEEYYVKMMVAWFFATALAKQYDATLPYIQRKQLEPWTHNKAIQKAVESYRVTPEQKAYLKTLKERCEKQ